jgi:hypothetical protein
MNSGLIVPTLLGGAMTGGAADHRSRSPPSIHDGRSELEMTVDGETSVACAAVIGAPLCRFSANPNTSAATAAQSTHAPMISRQVREEFNGS